ncbi:hypothetical protein FRC10_007932, partial [Ceratobasidium sp. 414]
LSPIHTALESWKTTHDQLVCTINAYTSACTSLQSTLSSSRPSFHEDYRDFDTALLTIEAELQGFEHYRKVLENGICSLKQARNLSYTLVPINIIPQPLLLSIFSYFINPEFAKRTHLPPPPGRKQRNPASTVSSVCASWRNLVLATPSFWSTIFFRPKDRKNRSPLLSLLRAGDALLDIQAALPNTLNIYEWLPLLRPRYDQIRSLDLVLPNMDLLRMTLAIWPQDSLAPSLQALSMKIVQTVYQTDAAPPKVLSDGAHNRFLQSLTSFSLYGGYFDWDSAAFIGLEHLQLGQIVDPGPTLSQILGMLRASPRLRTLCLTAMPMSHEEETYHPPVHLERLQKLSFMFSWNQELCALVPLLFPGSRPLTLHLGIELDHNFLIKLFSQLFRRSNIKSIYFHNRIPQQTMPVVFSTLPHLGYLYCSYNDMADVLRALSAPLPTGSSNTPSLLPCPQLNTLHFYKCKFEATTDRTIGPITNQPALVVKFQNCRVPRPGELSQPELAGGKVDFEYEAADLLREPPFDGVNYHKLITEVQTSQEPGSNMRSLSLIVDY